MEGQDGSLAQRESSNYDLGPSVGALRPGRHDRRGSCRNRRIGRRSALIQRNDLIGSGIGSDLAQLNPVPARSSRPMPRGRARPTPRSAGDRREPSRQAGRFSRADETCGRHRTRTCRHGLLLFAVLQHRRHAMWSTPSLVTTRDGLSSGQASICQPSSLTRTGAENVRPPSSDRATAMIRRIHGVPREVEARVWPGCHGRLAAEEHVGGKWRLGPTSLGRGKRVKQILTRRSVVATTAVPGMRSLLGRGDASVKPYGVHDAVTADSERWPAAHARQLRHVHRRRRRKRSAAIGRPGDSNAGLSAKPRDPADD